MKNLILIPMLLLCSTLFSQYDNEMNNINNLLNDSITPEISEFNYELEEEIVIYSKSFSNISYSIDSSGTSNIVCYMDSYSKDKFKAMKSYIKNLSTSSKRYMSGKLYEDNNNVYMVSRHLRTNTLVLTVKLK